MSSSGGAPVSYRPQVNRAITKRWAEAKQISYEGNDWGDDDDDYYESTPSSARGGQPAGWPAQNTSSQRYGAQLPQHGITPANRSFTNPSPTRSNGRKSFDRGDERRNFSAHAPSSSFEGPYPTAQPNPFPEPKHDFQQAHPEPLTRPLYGPPPLHVQTHARPQSRDRAPQVRPPSRDHPQYTRLPSTLDTRGGPYQDPTGGVTYGDGGRRTESSGPPSRSDLQGRSESPYRNFNPPMSARSQNSRDDSPARRFPPRKSSVSQDTPILEPSLQQPSSASATAGTPASDNTTGVKPLPFIRPADIYKRMEEEREKERRSQESSRPSVDSNASRPRERDIFTSARQSQESSRPKIDASGIIRDNRSPARAPPVSSQTSEQPLGESKSIEGSEDTETTRKLKSTLDPVAERKSEYGFENMLKEAEPDHPSSVPPATSRSVERATPLSASSNRSDQAEPLTTVSVSSIYSDRPDPITASSQSSGKSLPQFLPVFRGVSDFGTDFLDRNSTQRDSSSPTRQPPSEAQNVQSNSTAVSGAPSSSLQGGQDATKTRVLEFDPIDKELSHNPSTGPRSAVPQGFDNSQDQVPQTPLSMDESVVRSNSASTSDISPMLSRGTSSVPAGAGGYPSGNQHPSFAEEMDNTRTIPGQSAATKPHTLQEAAQTISEPALPPPPPPPVKDDYRKDYSIPGPTSSQSRGPLSVGTVRVPGSEVVSKTSATPTDTRKPWGIPHAISEDSQDLEGQTKPFRMKADLKDSPLPAPPSASSEIAGPSTRGTVRELTEKLESRSGRASPAISLDRDPEMPRPLHGRLDSFRPSLPGGWQSYSINTDPQSQAQEQSATAHSTQQAAGLTPMQQHGAEDSPVSSEDDDIPTAGPPKSRREDSDYGPSKTAFAAAAAAGSALVGAFTSVTGLDSEYNETPQSHEVSEDESIATHSNARDDVSNAEVGIINSKDKDNTLALYPEEEPPAPSPIAPSPPAKDTPSESDTPASTLGYFPLPLRTSRTAETLLTTTNDFSPPVRPPMLPVLSSDTSMQDTESDRLRKEIVRSLTPKSTRYEGEPGRSFDDHSHLPQIPVKHEPHSLSLDIAVVPEPDENNSRKPIINSDQAKSSPSQMPIAPIITDKALPQPITSLEDERQPDTTHARNATHVKDRPMLEQRFSWEHQPEIAHSEAGQPAESVSARSPHTPQGARGETGSPETIRQHTHSNTPSTTTSSRVLPVMGAADTLRHVQSDAPSGYSDPNRGADEPHQGIPMEPSFRPNQTALPQTGSNSLLNSSPRETPFRDILSLSTSQDRIQAFNTNREVIASQDTGLEEWLRAMGNRLPEYSDLLRNNGRLSAHENENLALYKPSPARSKFQRFASLANNNQSADPEYEPSVANSPSGGKGNNLHMPGQGKKLLKDAGKIGGQAGVVAKGLFAKGKNKLRAGGGGSDKAILAGRRRSSQPMIVIDEPQHSSVTANTAPQIPNLNISPIENEDQWYNSIDAASSPILERSVSPINPIGRQETNNQDLMLPGHVDRPVQQIRQSSPRVSAVGSFHDVEMPSRSISEVTRPTNSGDERSPIAPIPEDLTLSTVTENVAADGSRQPHLITDVPPVRTGVTPTRVSSAPVSDALGPLPNLPRTANAATNPAVTDLSFAEQKLSPDQDLTATAQAQAQAAASGAQGLASGVLNQVQPKGQPVHSETPSQDSLLPRERAEATMPDENPPANSEPAPQLGILNSGVPNRISQPPFDGATPPYTETNLSKEAEAAMYRSQVDPSVNMADGLPAYQSNQASVHDTLIPRVSKGDTIIPVADLSHQRQASSGPAQPRPFSFVAGDTLISRGHTPTEQVATLLGDSPIQPDLAKETSVASSEGDGDSLEQAKRKSKSYSRPFVTDPNVRDHPAYRQSQDIARNKETFIPTEHIENFQTVANRPVQTGNDDGQYRIPGPYVQEYRSPKQPPQALAVRQFPPPQPTSYEQPPQRPVPGMDPLRSHNPRGENQTKPLSQPINNDGVPATGTAAFPVNDRSRRHSKGGLFRTRSKPRSITSRNEEQQNVENKNQRRGGFFKQRTKGDGGSIRSKHGSLQGNAVDSRDSINRQMSREGVDNDVAHGERTDQVGDLRNSSSGNPLQHDARKKRFSGLGSLFGRSSTGGMKTSNKPQGQQSVQRASTLSHYLLGKPDVRPQQNTVAPDSMYAQNQQRHQTFPQSDETRNSAQLRPGFQGLNAPIGGYYAPTQQQQQAEESIMPHDPDSFSRGRFSAEPHTSPNQYHSQRNQDGYQGPYQSDSQVLRQQLPHQGPQPGDTRPPLQINTNTNQSGNARSLNHHLATAPPGPAPQFPLISESSSEPLHQVSYSSKPRPMLDPPYETRPGARPPFNYGGTNGTNQVVASHVIDLHKRSRSPRNGRRLSEDERPEEVNRNDPASQLGTFSNVAAPRSGGGDSSEQEAPWRIGLPNTEEEETQRKSRASLLERERERAPLGKTRVENTNAPPVKTQKEDDTESVNPRKSEEWRKQEQVPHEPTIAERVMGVQLARAALPLQRSTSAGNAMARPSKMSPVELPGSKAPGDDSDDEIVMSSTAYPGQEWAPENWGYGGNWDD